MFELLSYANRQLKIKRKYIIICLLYDETMFFCSAIGVRRTGAAFFFC